jgi:hypothetical protein
MSPVTAGAGAGAKLSEKLSTVASAAFGSTSRIVEKARVSSCELTIGCENTAIV